MQRTGRVLLSVFVSTLLFTMLLGSANAGHLSDPDWKPLPNAQGGKAGRSAPVAVYKRSPAQGQAGLAAAAAGGSVSTGLHAAGGSVTTGSARGSGGSSPAGVPDSSFSGKPTYWNTALPSNAPIDPNSADIISFIKSDNALNYVKLSGTTSDGKWGTPIYWAKKSDKTYAVVNSCSSHQPPEFESVRIPAGAEPDPTSDASMVVYDRTVGLVYAFWQTSYDSGSDTWSACGGTVYYRNSNGIVGSLPQSDEPRNYGHRGLHPLTYAVRYDEIMNGSINHVLRILVNTTQCDHVFPMSGDECGTSDKDAPPEGARIRIKLSVDLDSLGLSPEALVIARALQTYGAVIGDQSGGSVELKAENVVAEGKGWLWDGLLSSTALSAIPLDDFEVIELGYGG